MTRKRALIIARDSLKDKIAINKIQEIIDSLPIHEWSKITIIDAIEQFIEEEGRPPILSEFKIDRRLPKPSTLRYWMGIPLKTFMEKNYPDFKKCNSGVYYSKTKEEWLDIFICNYQKHKPVSAIEYNKLKDPNTPTWAVFAQLFGFKRWNELMEFTKLKRYIRVDPKKNRISSNLEVVSHNDLVTKESEYSG